MANVKITDLTALSATDSVDTDVFVVVDVSADQTKKMTLAEAVTAFSGDVETRRVANVTEQTAIEARRAANVTIMTNEDTALQARITANAATVTAIEARRVANVTEQTAIEARRAANVTISTNEDTALQARITANATIVTAVEARRVANVTEQTAIEARRAANVVGAISTVLTGDLTASRAMVTNGAGKIAISAVTATELGHLDGVSDAIQTQLDAKSSTSNAADLAAGIASSSPAVTAANILHTTSTANSYATGGATSDIDKVLVYLSGVYQGENNYVLGNSTHNVQFKDATLASGLELEIRKF